MSHGTRGEGEAGRPMLLVRCGAMSHRVELEVHSTRAKYRTGLEGRQKARLPLDSPRLLSHY